MLYTVIYELATIVLIKFKTFLRDIFINYSVDLNAISCALQLITAPAGLSTSIGIVDAIIEIISISIFITVPFCLLQLKQTNKNV